ncbi:DUF6858 family protein [Halarcobacter anaerophilus]|jgi:hypothetical protein|uniref:Uncharacterized protein n=1 Tax=Halarcobacter anaerophilus TaxID=877500 RepID=A0A4Q0XXR5_9BACT|nr:hypothetical protein [Halarcobacter anaerophilus]QDF28771.1 hypothetical protein AANAER_1287 [Halarcobacter anaerophilus]RXJ61865.1 hypothetical protein CRV06_11830 [Halarcobacter anaerophilus]
MKQKVFKEKYHIFEIEFEKKELNYKNVDEIIAALKEKIDANEIIAFISIFDQYAHTVKIKGDINPAIKDAKNIIFCFGKEIPTPEVLAVRPRAIGVVELEDSFVVNFLEAPNEQANVAMENIVKSIKK